ncbi:MFS transporter [Kordiimonas sediminis]|uniref:Bcr/CflA family efflux transporter n=1 Tax=Kordiimonas sediminis TaxID=1735581 RepID=A0A919E718_9PROT|nr:multidrug effflux MFS transporter [Kordiimonas sediminis]GHF25365.1 MFS transporter [Kordiimonas sediminis]
MSTTDKHIGPREFIALMAMLMSMLALSIDAMLPALSAIGESLQIEEANDTQLVISIVFLGVSMGLMIYGPLADSHGRKFSISVGLVIFLIGNLVSIFSSDLTYMLAGRFLQGFGAASCRVVLIAMIRDKFEGREMGRIMSLIMMIFIMVPIIAPSLGQAILLFTDWHMIFVGMALYGLATLIWLQVRLPETLSQENRLKFSLTMIKNGVVETLTNRTARGYMIASGTVYGAFIGYLSSSQQILMVQYELGELFAVVFGVLAVAIGLSSYLNSRLVIRFGMERLCMISLTVIMLTSLSFGAYFSLVAMAAPTLTEFLIYLSIILFNFGLLFGNTNSLAIQPLGHIAGVASSVISSIQMMISVIIGSVIGHNYNGTVMPLVAAFTVCSLLSLSIFVHLNKNKVDG